MADIQRLTPVYMDELWERIEDLERRLIDNPDDRGVAMLLDCCLRDYDAKTRLINKDSNSLAHFV